MTPYDAIRYPGLPYAHTHPDHLAAIATFFGVVIAPPDRCRVLEVGCGDGGNLVPMAYALPKSEFVGIDLAGETVQAAQAFARQGGVANVRFETLDLTRFPTDAGTFDYIIAHGVYSWIPVDARDALMALIGRHLAPKGVAFVSYNTYPGCHLRRMVWEMLKFHTGELDDPQSQLAEAQTLIRLIAHGNAQPDQYTQPLVTEAQRMEGRIPPLLFHDDLSPVNEPVYFHEFVDHAARHGLQFLAESNIVESSYAGIAPEARGMLATMDPITRQQYLDFIKCRRFRETLLCRNEVALDRLESVERMRPLTFTPAHRVRNAPQDGNTHPATPETLAASDSADAERMLIQVILEALRAAVPHPLAFAAMVEQARASADAEQLLAKLSVDLDAILLAAMLAGVIEPHIVAPKLAFPPGNKPTASGVVRAQLAAGDVVTSLWHKPVKVDDEIALRLLPLLDGTRDRGDLLAVMSDLIGTEGSATTELDTHLLRLAKLGLLIA